jgi:hypothetical protein
MNSQKQNAMSGQINQTKIKPNMQQNQQNINTFIPPRDEIDSRNEIFAKSGTDPMYQERKPLTNLHSKINRGISPNQPPISKSRVHNENDPNVGTHGHPSSGASKHKSKESSESTRRSNSLKIKKDNERIPPSNKSTRGSHRGGGSFIVPSSTTNKKSSSLTKKSTKEANSAQSLRTGYSKSASHSNTGSNNTSGHYRLGSNYGVRNPSSTNFTANSRIRKSGPSNPNAHNTMASFRSGPVKIINDKSEANAGVNGPSTSSSTYNKKDASKRPSSASKVTKKSSKMVAKTSNRPGTASTRTNSNRPPSPGSRSLKSDLLFSSYNKHK